MNRFSKIYKTITVLIAVFPFVIFAQLGNASCSSNGYTIETINGIFTDEGGALANKKSLGYFFSDTYNGEPLTIDYLLNKTHSLLDVTDTAIQKTFEWVNMWDPDFIAMLNDASEQVKTQKLLLVSHSQGNFYANNVYKVVTDSGDVSKKSIGVYGIASPAGYVAGGGRHLTSSTDKVIAFLVENVLSGTIAPANDTIDYKWSDDSGKGHGFSEIYLKYRPAEIVRDIKWSLDRLALDPTRSEDGPCINRPKEIPDIINIIQPGIYVGKTVFVGVSTLGTIGKNIAVGATVLAYNVTTATAVWSYNTTISATKALVDTTISLTSAVSSGLKSLMDDSGNLATSNSATVILATQAPVSSLPNTSLSASQTNTKPVSLLKTPISSNPASATSATGPVVTTSQSAKPSSSPKLIFVGIPGAGFGGGGGAPPQVLGTQATVEVADEVVDTGGSDSGVGIILGTPILSVPQCAYSLATSTGCLFATTTVRFEWEPVSGADHYSIAKNGTYTTTTELFADIISSDFSDYTFDISAVGASGNTSATSTQTVSVATIPIAINEIAWMGTIASANDEWFEIKNNTNHTIDLSQWVLQAMDKTPYVSLSGVIAPHAYLVFERTNDETITDVTAHQTYTGSLLNTGEQISLSYASTTLDQTPYVSGGAWTAGTTTTYSTMERYSSRDLGINATNWGTNLIYVKNGTDAEGNAIAGTPGAQNSVSTLVNKGEDITEDFTLTAIEERYVIVGTMNVSASSTLTITPGVSITFYEKSWTDPAGLNVYGTLDVYGVPENQVTFDSLTATPVGSIELFGNSTSTITSAHFDTTYSGVNIYSGSLEISNSSFENVKYEAVGVYSGASASVSSSTISNITRGDAIGVYGNSTLEVASTTIDGVLRGSGIAVYDSELLISSSTIRNVDDSGLLLSNASSTVSDVIIENAEWIGIEIYEGNATITDTEVSGVTGWAGISVSIPTEPVVITGGEVVGNVTGISMDAGSAILTDVSVHDNGESESDNIVTW